MSTLFEFESPAKDFAVMGNPIAHSKSPIIHQLFAEQFAISLNYQKIQVDPGGFDQAVSHFIAHGGIGLNITVPYKVEAWQLCDKQPNSLSERAIGAGSVNTMTFSGDSKIHGDNTDGVGLLRDLQHNIDFNLANSRILIAGAGGSVRGILNSLLQTNPALIAIANRTINKAQQLAESAGSTVIACGLDIQPKEPFDLIINATSTSLSKKVLQLDSLCIGEHTLAYDLMYSEQKTPFMKWALGMGANKISDGLGMLVEQAAESFFIWHGRRPDTQPTLSALRKY